MSTPPSIPLAPSRRVPRGSQNPDPSFFGQRSRSRVPTAHYQAPVPDPEPVPITFGVVHARDILTEIVATELDALTLAVLGLSPIQAYESPNVTVNYNNGRFDAKVHVTLSQDQRQALIDGVGQFIDQHLKQLREAPAVQRVFAERKGTRKLDMNPGATENA